MTATPLRLDRPPLLRLCAYARVLLAFALLAHVCPASAFAGIADNIGLGTRATAMGGAYTARPGDFAATYYNPAGLAPCGTWNKDESGLTEMSFGFIYSRPVVDVESLDGVSLSTASEAPTAWGFVFGNRMDLGRIFGIDGLNMGTALYFPSVFFQWSIDSEDQMQWLFLGDRTQVVGIHWGIGYRITSWMSLGFGLHVLFDTETLTFGRVLGAEMEETEDGGTALRVDTQLGEEERVYGHISPTAGLLFAPVDGLTIGLSYRAQTFVDDWGFTRIQGVPGLGDLGYNHHFNHYFQPHQVNLGVGFQVNEGLSLSSDLVYRRWAKAQTTSRNYYGDGYFGDTWTPAVGASWEMISGVDLLGGFTYVTSPFDNFGGPSNLLDNHRSVFSLGMTYRLGRLLANPDLELDIHWAAQLAWLHDREERKDFRRFASDSDMEENPGFPGFTYGGFVPSGSVSIEVEF